MRLKKGLSISAGLAILFVWILKTYVTSYLRGKVDNNYKPAKTVNKTLHTLFRARKNYSSVHVVIVGRGRHQPLIDYPLRCHCEGMLFYVNNVIAEVAEADIVVFSTGAARFITETQWKDFHNKRNMSQLWVLHTNESPLTCVSLRPPEDIRGVTFNLSFIYHTESDIPTPYGWFQKFDSPKDEHVNWFSIKTKLIMWTSSHCSLSSRQYKRRDFVLSLKRYLDISMFGTCGDYALGGDEYLQTSSEYKFVLALENSCCSQYITEKFWDALTIYNQVPVVYGATREEYEKVAPPNSFIFIQDFSSLESLSKTIQEIGSNEEKYNRYHSWRRLGYTMKQHKGQDRIYKCHSICRLSEREGRAKHGEKFHFNETGELYYGGCRNCQGEVDALTGMK